MELKILHATCRAGPSDAVDNGISKHIYIKACRSESLSGSDDVVFIEDGSEIFHITRNKTSRTLEVHIHSDDRDQSDLIYLKGGATDWGIIHDSPYLNLGIDENLFNELYYDIKSGASPSYMSFQYIDSFVNLPFGISRSGYAPDSPLLWDLAAVKKLPVKYISFQYGEQYDKKIDGIQNKNEIKIKNREYLYESIENVRIEISSINENIKYLSEIMIGLQVSAANLNRKTAVLIAIQLCIAFYLLR